MDVDVFFAPADEEAVAAAVRAVEERTGGEIVPYAVARSDDYAEAAWKGAFLGALLLPLLAAAAHRVAAPWGALAPWIALPPVVGGGLGYLATLLLAPLRRLLAGEEVLAARVEARARAAFLDEEVFRTRDRTGVLLFVSLFERRVVVLADRGIHARVDARAWEELARAVARGLRSGRKGEALVEGVRRCGEILEAGGVARRPDDRDGLGDRLRTERP